MRSSLWGNARTGTDGNEQMNMQIIHKRISTTLCKLRKDLQGIDELASKRLKHITRIQAGGARRCCPQHYYFIRGNRSVEIGNKETGENEGVVGVSSRLVIGRFYCQRDSVYTVVHHCLPVDMLYPALYLLCTHNLSLYL
jgi:hypothetical protein